MDPRESQNLEDRILKQVRQILATRDRIGSEQLSTDTKLAVEQLNSNLNSLKDSLRVTSAVVEDLNVERQRVSSILAIIDIKLNDGSTDTRLKALKEGFDLIKSQLEASTIDQRVVELEKALSGLAPRVLSIESMVNSIRHNNPTINASIERRSVTPVAAATPNDSKYDELKQLVEKQQAIINALSRQAESNAVFQSEFPNYVKSAISTCLDPLTNRCDAQRNDIMETVTKLNSGLLGECDRRIQEAQKTAVPSVDLAPLQQRIAALEAAKPQGNIISAGIGSIGSAVTATAGITGRLDALEIRVKHLETSTVPMASFMGRP